MVVAEESDVYHREFDRFRAERSAKDPAWLSSIREQAMARFAHRGFPGPREEAWRHTNVGQIAKTTFRPASPDARVSAEVLAAASVRGTSITFVNGRHSRELSSPPQNPGVEVLSLREALERQPDRLTAWLGSLTDEADHAFADLNRAFLDDGALVLVAPGAVIAEPIQVAWLSANPEAGATVCHPRLLIVAGRGSQLTLVETFAGDAGQLYLTNAVAEILVEDGASVSHYRLQREGANAYHLGQLTVRQGRDSRYRDLNLSLGAVLSRLDIAVRLEQPGAECTLDGLFLVDGSRHADTHTTIDHLAPHCSSHQLYKGVLTGRAQGVFHGRIRVRPGAQKTDAVQANRNLLLSREALVHSTPQLEILADDVKCRHASTTGQLDSAALFYLRSRGIAEEQAKGLLALAFAEDVLRGLTIEPLRAVAEAFLAAQVALASGREAIAS
jgi:Fe-S cluster assembly protein SufD